MASERLRIVWTPPNGGAPIEFSDEMDAQYFLLNVNGFLANRVSPVVLRAPGQRGGTLADVMLESRSLALQAWLTADTAEAMWAAREVLGGSFAIEPDSREVPEAGVLTIYRPSFPVREIEVIPIDSPQDEFLTETTLSVDIEFFAPYPYFRAADDEMTTFIPSGGIGLPVELPMEFPTSGVAANVDNIGTVSAPVIIRIDGEVDTPRIENLTTGKVLELEMSIASGDYVLIDTSFARKSIRLYPDDANAIANVNLAFSDFWSLKPGFNELMFSATSIGAGASVTVTWRPEWAGI